MSGETNLGVLLRSMRPVLHSQPPSTTTPDGWR